ncbi:aminotransferase [Methylobacillus sp. MM3]|uniref:MalY/PatB family protein n=1 Tax=Methylobacillus sp. MM3 TaxID=1848039 RepID=UPI0007E01EAE|nr:pyridoxal phosphate-dependent aminotransferase [Methylobacillus sp. MM3]OAJ70214.1 aminotransferase [Methylobacillus sp. MM3]
MSFDFDRVIPREGTSALKYDGRTAYFGTSDVQPLWVADMDFAAPEAVTHALIARATHPIYGYTLPPESVYDALIGWMKKRHAWVIEREWIVLVPGVVPSLNAVAMALTEPDEGVIVQPPVYFPFFSAATKTGRRLVQNPLKLDNGRYSIDFEHLEQCAQEARLLLLCSPHNPVGRVWQREELTQVLDIARRHDLTVLADEIHADLIYPEYRHRALATLTDDTANIVTAVAPSKTFNIPGLGLSALIIPDSARRTRINQVLDMVHMTAGNPFSLTAFEAAYREGAPWLESLMAYLQKTRDEAARYIELELPRIKLIPAEGTYLLWLDCRELGMRDDELKRFMIHEAGLGLSPGIAFGMGGSGFMRMNIGAPRSLVMEALEKLKAALR